MSLLRQICDCGHDKATHHFDERGPGDCLGMQCECLGYHEPGTPPLKRARVQLNETWDDTTPVLPTPKYPWGVWP